METILNYRLYIGNCSIDFKSHEICQLIRLEDDYSIPVFNDNNNKILGGNKNGK